MCTRRRQELFTTKKIQNTSTLTRTQACMQFGPTILTAMEKFPHTLVSITAPLWHIGLLAYTGLLHLRFTKWPMCLEQHQTELG